jgi:predicted secreted protein
VLSIIDRAIEEFQTKSGESGADQEQVSQAATTTVVNLSRTLGKLSYSRLQCGQAEVLAEFTQRVQKLPQDFRDPMRDAFQEGFDQSKTETPLLSEDECARLTQSRSRGDTKAEVQVKDEDKPAAQQEVVEEEPEEVEDPIMRHLRIAELSGQLAYKRKFCGDKRVVNRDFNEVIGNMPEEFQEEAKKAYWKGYQHGKRLNKGLTQARCGAS